MSENSKTHILKTIETCIHENRENVICPVCDWGLGVCSICGAAECELDEYSCEEFKAKRNGPVCHLPAAQTENRSMLVDIDIVTDRFWLKDNNGDEAQVRLDPDGKIFLCYATQNRRTIELREIPWTEFIVKFRAFVDSIK